MTHSTSSVMGKPILFHNQQLHGMLFTPARDIVTAVLLISPLFDEQRCAHRALVCCARALAQAGALVLIPELTGTANSQGDLRETDLSRWSCDLEASRTLLLERAKAVPFTMLACRGGALLASSCIDAGWKADNFILWHPVTEGKSYLKQLRTRRMIQDKMTGNDPATSELEIEGQELSAKLYAGIQALRLPDEAPPMPTRLLQCSFTEKVLGEYTRLLERWARVDISLRCVTCAPFWLPHSPGEYQELSQVIVEEVLI